MPSSSRRKKTARRAVVASVAAPWQRNQVVVRATRTILSIERATAKQVIDAVVEVGRLLGVVKDALPTGEWIRWLEDAVFFERRTATRYMAVELWARTKPREFARLRGVSITKVYRLLALTPDERRSLIGRRIPIPNTDLRLRLEEMTVAHLDSVIRTMRALPPADDPVPRLLEAVHQRIDALETQTDALIEHADAVPRSEARTVHRDLVAVTRRLKSAFSL